MIPSSCRNIYHKSYIRHQKEKRKERERFFTIETFVLIFLLISPYTIFPVLVENSVSVIGYVGDSNSNNLPDLVFTA